MKIPELRSVIAGYSADDLRLLTVELYRRIPKKIIEEKELDQLVADPQGFLEAKKKPKPIELPDLDYLTFEIEEFVEDALKSYYFAPNSMIRKSERSKWRFHVKRFHRELMMLMQDPTALAEVSRLLERLFDVLCRAEEVYLFNSTDPFNSIGVARESFYADIVQAQRAAAPDQRWIRQAIETLVPNAGYYARDMIIELVNQLTTNPLREEALNYIVQAYKNLPKLRQRKTNTSDQKSHLAELALRISFGLREYDRGIAFFLKYHDSADTEITVYLLLNILSEYELTDLWLREYDNAVQRGIPLRDQLRRQYRVMKEGTDSP